MKFVLNETSYFGANSRENLVGEIKSRGFSKVLLVSDNELIKVGVTKKVEETLKDNNITYSVFSDIKQNPTIKNVLDGVHACKESNADVIVAVGGGSSIDTAKGISIVMTNPDRADIRSLNGLSNTQNRGLPLIALPTTAGTAAEVTINYVITDVEKTIAKKYYTLGSDSPYFSFFDVSEDTEHQIEARFACNFGLIVRDSEIIIGGEKADIPLAFREQSTTEYSEGALTLDTKNVSFKAGDSIKLTLILLPWGVGNEESDKQVLTVREDSALNPVTVTTTKGTVKEDKFVPGVIAENGETEFTIKGGRNNIAVRVDGFTNLNCPEILMNGEKVNLASSNGYDGYSVFYNDDGTYSFSFVYEAKDPYTEYKFEVKQ